MSNAVFPDLPGIDIKVRKTPIWNTRVQRAVSGRELRTAFYSYPLYKLAISYNFLRAGAEAELQAIVGFFNARKGSFDNFLFSDPLDSVAADQQFGVGDGANIKFQLTRAFGGNTEPVMNINGTPSITVDDVPRTPGTDYTLDSLGMVTFMTAPAAGAVLRWTGAYYYRVRFERDEMDFEQFLWELWEAKRVELRGSLGTKI
jgi:uncharacterized protein (TIGR02217 family)